MPPFLQGLTIGLAYVAPIGMQNLFVINAALTQPRRRALLTALIVVFFDVTLALACFFGVGALMEHFAWLQRIVLLAGGAVVMWIGVGLLREKPVLHAGGAGGLPAFSGGAGIAGVGSVAGAAGAAAGGQGRCHGQSHQQGQQSLHVSSPFSSQKRFRGGHRPPPRLPPAERRKNGPLCQAVHGKYGKKPPAGTIPNSH